MINNKRKKICSKIINKEKEKEEMDISLFLRLTCFKRIFKMKVANSIMIRKMNKILIKIKIK